ncbi:MAG: phosphatidylserine decarboxylase [Planctomycetota bacterium]
MTLTMYGFRTWGAFTAVALVLAAIILGLGLWLGQPWWWGWVPIGIWWLAFASFFRDPVRRVPTDLPEGAMLSPADGRISAIEHVDEHESTEGPTVIIRMFLSVLNVHVNRSACDGEVTAISYVPGRFLDARSAESAKINEYNLVTIRMTNGETMGLRQVSGKVARHIICALQVGDRVKRGQKFGMIKFGSTAEVILPRPDDVTINVEVGDKVRGGLTVLAELAPRTDAP